MKKLFLIASLSFSSCIAFANNQAFSYSGQAQQNLDGGNLEILDLDNLKDKVLKINLGKRFQNKPYQIDCLDLYICRKVFYKDKKIENEFYFIAYQDITNGKKYIYYYNVKTQEDGDYVEIE